MELRQNILASLHEFIDDAVGFAALKIVGHFYTNDAEHRLTEVAESNVFLSASGREAHGFLAFCVGPALGRIDLRRGVQSLMGCDFLNRCEVRRMLWQIGSVGEEREQEQCCEESHGLEKG